MAGINAIAAAHSGTDLNGSTVFGYVTGEQIAFSTTPSGTAYQWTLSKPITSTDRAELLLADTAAPKLVPDVGGYYTIAVVVDGTTYYAILVVAEAADVIDVEAIRMAPVADSTVSQPAAGAKLYWSSTQNALALKRPSSIIYLFQHQILEYPLVDASGSVSPGAIVSHVVSVSGINDGVYSNDAILGLDIPQSKIATGMSVKVARGPGDAFTLVYHNHTAAPIDHGSQTYVVSTARIIGG